MDFNDTKEVLILTVGLVAGGVMMLGVVSIVLFLTSGGECLSALYGAFSDFAPNIFLP